jgi:hypothetical protein
MPTADMFFYKYPRLKENLQHKTIEVNMWGTPLGECQYPTAYVLYSGLWFLYQPQAPDPRKPFSVVPAMYSLRDTQVPKEIRTMALLIP